LSQNELEIKETSLLSLDQNKSEQYQRFQLSRGSDGGWGGKWFYLRFLAMPLRTFSLQCTSRYNVVFFNLTDHLTVSGDAFRSQSEYIKYIINTVSTETQPSPKPDRAYLKAVL